VEDLQQVILAVGLLAALAIALFVLHNKGLVRFALKGNSEAKQRRLQTIERLPLTPQHSLHLVRVADRTVLIAVSPGGCSVLDGTGWDSARDREGFPG